MHDQPDGPEHGAKSVRKKARVRWFVFGSLLLVLGLLVRPVSSHVRAVSLLTQMQTTPAPPTGGVVEEVIHDGARTVRMYVPQTRSAATPCVVLAHGIHYKGIDEPRFVRFARALASTGAVVETPELPALADYRVEKSSVDLIGRAAHELRGRCSGHRVGVMGVSFGGGLSVLAAADPVYGKDIRFVLSVGGHDDLERIATFFVTNEVSAPDGHRESLQAHDYGIAVFVHQHIQEFFPDDPEAKLSLTYWLHESRDEAFAHLAKMPETNRKTMQKLFDHDLSAWRPLLADIRKSVRANLAEVSPHTVASSVHVPVYLLHGSHDSVVPPTEALWLASELPKGSLKSILITPVFTHVEIDKADLWFEKWRLVRFMAQVISEMDAVDPRE